HVLLDGFAVVVHLRQRRWADESFNHARKHESQGKIERGVDTDELTAIARLPPNEPRDRLLVIEHLAERKEVPFTVLERRFTGCIAKDTCQIVFQEFERVDAESIHVVPGDYELIATNEEALYVIGFRAELPQ